MSIPKNLKYEEALKRLQVIVQMLEAKEVKIDELADKVKEAKELVDYCREKLDRTEDEIKKIIDKDQGIQDTPDLD